MNSSDIYVLVDNNSRNYCMEHLNMGYVPREHIITIAEGEYNKSLESVVYIWHILSEDGARRNAELINQG